MDLDEGLQAFVAEAGELLVEMESGLLKLGRGEPHGELIHAVFRAAHTIKGTAGLFSLESIVVFTHAVESVLDGVRDGSRVLDERLIVLLLSCADHITAMVDDVARGGQGDLGERGVPLLEQLHRYLGLAEQPPEQASAAMSEAALWHISVQFGEDVFRQGMDPAAFISYLSQLGELAAVAVVDETLPPAADMDAESCYLGFEIVLRTVAGQAQIEKAFEFVQRQCTLHVLSPNAAPEDYVRLAQRQPLHARAIAEVLNATARIVPPALLAVPASSARPKAAAPAAAPAPHSNGEARENRTIRVDADRLGHLITLVGELIIASARTGIASARLRDAELRDSTELLASLVEEVRDSALQLRMVRIGATFRRFQRMVHDVAREQGKEIRLLISGEDVELDKTLVERIADPLTHLVRNAVDHGLESTAERQALGKPAQGTITLNALHDAGTIVIEVSDDGRGLARDKILEKAIALGLAGAEQNLSDGEVHALIFEPGFTTASEITNLSGRGVGMDVVRENIEALRGSITIDSTEGQGTTVRVRLPLTLAIIDCLLVRVGESSFALPLSMVDECVAGLEEEAEGLHQLRGEVLPTIVLRDLFRLSGPAPRRESVVVVRHAGQKAGLVVDALLGQIQAVMKPLSPLLAGSRCISGSTILGGGEVALVLDLPALLKLNKETWTC
ncbi:chemotaxis protein CheA [Pseudoduganella sp. RAF53_2]|uniref:chemotaxis protein CheA n=1 Tax=unclassified Pseudoduganella TaxID=2637179 RepID=UPI003F95A236